MERFDINCNTEFFLGRSKENDVGRLIKFHGGTRVLLHYGKKTPSLVNLLGRVKRSMEVSGLEYAELGTDDINVKIETAFEGMKICSEKDLDYVLAIGDDNILGSAKIIAGALKLNDNFFEMFKENYVLQHALPIGIIQITAAMRTAITGEANIYHALDDGSLQLYRCVSPKLIPEFVILNQELNEASKDYLGSGCVSVIAKAIERYFLDTESMELSDRICESIMQTVILMHGRIKENPNDFFCHADIIKAALMEELDPNFKNYNDCAIEKFVTAFICLYDCSRADALALVMPAWLEFMIHKKQMRMAQLGVRLFGLDMNFEYPEITASEALAKFREFLKDAGFPEHLAQIGGSGADIEDLLRRIGFPENETIGLIKLTRVDCEVILSLAMKRY